MELEKKTGGASLFGRAYGYLNLHEKTDVLREAEETLRELQTTLAVSYSEDVKEDIIKIGRLIGNIRQLPADEGTRAELVQGLKWAMWGNKETFNLRNAMSTIEEVRLRNHLRHPGLLSPDTMAREERFTAAARLSSKPSSPSSSVPEPVARVLRPRPPPETGLGDHLPRAGPVLDERAGNERHAMLVAKLRRGDLTQAEFDHLAPLVAFDDDADNAHVG
jgi:hypothetical protein